MNCKQRTWAFCLAILVSVPLPADEQGHLSSPPAKALEDLPRGETGIAAKYPGDLGIEEDPSVLFSDDFDDYESVSDIEKTWGVVINGSNLEIATRDGGGRSLAMFVPKRSDPLSTGVAKRLLDAQDTLFLRWYMKYDGGWAVPEGSVHNGASISSRYFEKGRATPGARADGRNKFLVNFESENSVGKAPGNLNVYVYWPEQASRWGDHFFPSGTVLPFSGKRSGVATFGSQFEARPDISPRPGRWHCYEYMVRVNALGRRDGRIVLWFDGKLIADFPDLRLRDSEDLKVDRFGLELYIADNSARENRKWHDNVVAATSYIGPIAPLGEVGGDEDRR